MMRKSGGRIASALAFVLVASVAAPPCASAQDGATVFKPEELEQIVAPVALYPDPLLAQVSLQGDPLNEALKQVYQKNLGADTARVAGAMTSFNPDRSWDRITFTTAQQ